MRTPWWAGIADEARSTFPLVDYQKLAAAFTQPIHPTLFESITERWNRQFRDTFEALRRRALPSNLHDVDELDIDTLDETIQEGIPLYLVPRATTAAALMNATSAQQRRQIIGDRHRSILADCEGVIKRVGHPAYAFEGNAVQEAIDVFRAGRIRAAQALAAAVMDSLLWRWGDSNPDERWLVVRPANGGSIDDFPFHLYMAMVPARTAHEPFRPTGGDPIPTAFNRHASLHRVSHRQYSKRNATLATMHAVSLLGFFAGVR